MTTFKEITNKSESFVTFSQQPGHQQVEPIRTDNIDELIDNNNKIEKYDAEKDISEFKDMSGMSYTQGLIKSNGLNPWSYTATGWRQLWTKLGGKNPSVYLNASPALRAFAFNELTLSPKGPNESKAVFRFVRPPGHMLWILTSVVSPRHSLRLLDDANVLPVVRDTARELGCTLFRCDKGEDLTRVGAYNERLNTEVAMGMRFINSETGQSSLQIKTSIYIKPAQVSIDAPKTFVVSSESGTSGRVRHVMAGSGENRAENAATKIREAVANGIEGSEKLALQWQAAKDKYIVQHYSPSYFDLARSEVLADIVETEYGFETVDRAKFVQALDSDFSCVERGTVAHIVCCYAACGDSDFAGKILQRQ